MTTRNAAKIPSHLQEITMKNTEKSGTRRLRRALVAAGALAAGAATVVGVVPAGAAGAAEAGRHHPPRTTPETRTIATSTLGDDIRVTLTAVRSTQDDLAANVRLSTYTMDRGHWKLQDTEQVGKKDSWFWFPLTGSGAVCEFSTASRPPQRIKVQLLITPSIGCSPVHRFQVRDGRIVTG
ncbi:hypothetical protein [Streptomyces pactum]|uniref:hypothetical protein n=1 Tax=Streptomyces pactum TaxID=68249 RepID=UPI0036FB2538